MLLLQKCEVTGPAEAQGDPEKIYVVYVFKKYKSQYIVSLSELI